MTLLRKFFVSRLLVTAEMLAAYFEAQGYAVIPVAWGADAVRQAQEGVTPDLILLDIRLPDMDGFEVCKRLRSHRRSLWRLGPAPPLR